MKYISILNNLFNIAKKNNLLIGMIIFDIISVVLFLLFPYYLIFYYGELGVVIGAIIGTIFTFRYRKPEKEILKIGLYFILLGALLTSLTLSIIELVIVAPYLGLNFVVFLNLLVSNSIMVYTLTTITALIVGYFYSIKSNNAKKSDEFDDLFAELKKNNK